MKKISILMISMFLIFSAHAKTDWKQIKEKDGITVYKAKVPGSKIVAFKGKVIIDVAPTKVMWVLADRDHRKDWVDRLDRNRDLEVMSQKERVIYQSFKMPFLISNRDMVYKSVITKSKSGTVTYDMFSVEHPKAPETIGVRVELIKSKYILKPLGKNKTEVQVEILSDPKGMLPKWLVNLIQKSWPLKTLRALRTQCFKPFVKHYKM